MALAFHHLAIRVRDLAAAEAFYAGLLGLPVLARHSDAVGAPRSIWVGTGEGFVAIERSHAPATEAGAFGDDEAGFFLLALRIAPEERDAWRARLEAAGFPCEKETPFTFYVRDPEGNRVGFSHHPLAR